MFEAIRRAHRGGMLRKYEAGMDRIGITPGDYFAEFSSGIRISPARWRVFVSE